jgi:hypothetical protein
MPPLHHNELIVSCSAGLTTELNLMSIHQMNLLLNSQGLTLELNLASIHTIVPLTSSFILGARQLRTHRLSTIDTKILLCYHNLSLMAAIVTN